MSTIKISSLTELVTLTDPVELPVAYLGVTKKITARHIQDYVLGNLTVVGTTLGTNTSSQVIQLASDVLPKTDETYSLGSSDKKFKTVWVGTGSVYITDKTLGTNAELTVDNGVLQINGANQLQVGQLKFSQNTIESTTGGTDIQIGLTTSTANLVLNRNTVIAAGKTLTVNGAFLHNGLYIEKPNYVTVSSAGTYTASTLTSINILLYTAGSVNVTWTMPPNPIDGQVCKWTNANTQTSVFFISPGVTLIPAISGPYNAGTKFQYVYRSADNKWYDCP